MREIKFRGKTGSNTWAYGDLLHTDTDAIISDEFTGYRDGYTQCWSESVDIDTIGQYTGLKDKNGVEIYEDDIVKISTLALNYERKCVTGIVKFIDACFTVVFSQPVYDIFLKTNRKSLYVKCFTINYDIEVIGNVHDNPEIIEE